MVNLTKEYSGLGEGCYRFKDGRIYSIIIGRDGRRFVVFVL